MNVLRYIAGVYVALFTLLIAIQSAPAQQSNDRRTWYQAYADAQKDIQDKNWQKALADLTVAAQRGAPKPGRNVLFYGDVYRDYNPDYYFGIAYTNLQRFAEADAAFERVRQAQLINPRDATYAEFVRQTASAKDGLTKLAAAVRPNTSPPGPVTQPPPVQNPTTQNAATQTGPAQTQTPAQTRPNIPPPPVTQNAANVPNNVPPANNPPVGQNSNAANATNAAVAGAVRPAAQPPAKVPTPRRTNPLNRPIPQATANAAPIVPPPAVLPPPVQDERAGVLQFFSGDYQGAAASLAAVTSASGASDRAHFYLACAQTALVLTGKAPRTSLDAARAELALARDTGQFAADKRLISPRIAQELRMQP